MPALPQIDAQIKRLKPVGDAAQTEYRDENSPGLSLIVGKRRKSWSLTYTTIEGKRRRLSLGVYPETSLANARRRAEDTRAAVRQSVDPQAA
jgi:hypothetical protein